MHFPWSLQTLLSFLSLSPSPSSTSGTARDPDAPVGAAVLPVLQRDLPAAFADLAAPRPTLSPEDQIRNVMALYPLCVDGKQWDALSLVFYDDVWANYSALVGVFHPLSALKEGLANIVSGTTTHHQLGFPQVLVAENGRSARSLTYFSAGHFGTRDMWGERVLAWGIYQDYWLRNMTSGRWKIIQRTIEYPGESSKAPLMGNLDIFGRTDHESAAHDEI